MYVRTLPREIAARWIRPGDEIAVYEVAAVANFAGERRWTFARTDEYVTRHKARIDWMLVIDGARHVRPPADKAENRPEGTVRHSAGGWWSVEAMARENVPAGVDHVGTHHLVLVPIVSESVGPPITAWCGDAEQFVIRERVKVDASTMDSDNGRVSSRLRILAEPAEGQHAQRAVATVSDAVASSVDNDEVTRFVAALRADDENEAADRAALAALGMADEYEPSWAAVGLAAAVPPDDEGVMPIPPDVHGEALGRTLQESAAVNFTSERDSHHGSNRQ